MFSKEQLAEISKQQSQDVALTAKFLQSMGYGTATNPGVTYGAQYDSIRAQAAEQNIAKSAFMPAALITLENALEGKTLPNGDGKAFNAILDSIGFACTAYRNRHGGDMPSPNLVASAIGEAALLYEGLDNSKTQGMYDSVSANASSHMAEVPSLAMVTIAVTIANASPIVAYLPNPKGTQTVPLVYVRHVAKTTFGQMSKNDFLDGAKAGAQYFDAVHRFKMASADQTTFTIKAHRSVLEGTLDPDTNVGVLPLVAGATLIHVSGIPVGHDETKHAQAGATTGEIPVTGINFNGFELEDELYKVVSGTVDLATSTITVTFDKALPAETRVIAHAVANYEARDNNNNYILTAPSVDTALDYTSVTARGIRAIYTATIDALTQMQNELGLDMRAAFVATVIAKLMLEQNVRLLSDAKERAVGQGVVRAVDLTRGSDMTAAFNKTADIAAELLPAIDEIKRRIIAKSSHSPSGFDVYVTGSLSTLVKTLADDTNFIPTGLTLGAPNNIVRIGSRGTDNYYYVPETLSVLDEGEQTVGQTQVSFGEILVVARNAEAAKSVFVGHIAVPVVTDEVKATVFEKGVEFYTRQASEMNKNSRFGGQVGLLRVLNVPKSLTTEV